jgi:GntR family transcriptional regulator, sialic acid-inducible nan operon repressor
MRAIEPMSTGMLDTSASAADTRAADGVVRELEAEIVAGKLKDGAHLPSELELIERFGASRTVIREAIAKLASRGLVESRPRFRPIVRRPGIDAAFSAVGGVVSHLLRDKGGVKNLYDTRILLEAGLVRHAALHARKDDIAALRDALARNEKAIPDPVEFDRTDVEFHAVFYAIPGNPVLPAIHRAFVSWLFDHWQSMARSAEQNAAYHFSHREIFQFILERDPDAAETALLGHLNAAWESVRVTF